MYRRYVIAVLAIATLFVGALGVMAQDEMPPATIQWGGTDELGPFLVDANGMTLYLFTNDEAAVSNCAGDCAANWPPLTVEAGDRATLDPSVPGIVGEITREDGGRQVVYNGTPLYYFAQDAAPGDTTGQGRGDVWYVVTPPDVSVSENTELGYFLVGPNGMTLYSFDNDEMGVSNCAGDCAVNWPPLTVADGMDVTAQPGLVVEVGTITRDDGSTQVTYHGMPLYYWKDDMAPGDATGQGVGDVWWVVKPPTVSVGGNDELGEFVVGPNGMTLYMFFNDEPPVSNCYDQCATAWPPLIVGADEMPIAGEGVTGTLGTSERTDGTTIVTLNDNPLYYWWDDNLPGDSTGQGVGDVWYVLTPDGTVVGP